MVWTDVIWSFEKTKITMKGLVYGLIMMDLNFNQFAETCLIHVVYVFRLSLIHVLCFGSIVPQ